VAVISSNSFIITPGAITGGLAPTLTTTLPSLTPPVAPGTTVSFTIAGCGSGAVSKVGGGAVALADLGTSISFTAPVTTATDNKTCTYTLTVTNPTNFATATGTLQIVPAPVLASGVLTVTPGAITGGATGALSVALPALTSAVASAATVSLVILGAGCGSGNVNKSGGAAVAAADLGTTITINPPTTALTDNLSCGYTLTVANAATTARIATATGTLGVIPQPTLLPTSLTVGPAAITGGPSAPATISITLPQLTSAAASMTSVNFAISGGGACGSGTVAKSGGGAVGTGDVHTSGTNGITVNTPTTVITDNVVCTYTLTVSNNATTPGTAVATGTLTLLPKPVLGSGTFTLVPASITIATTTPDIGTTLPTLNSPAPVVANTVTFVISGTGCGTGNVNKTNGGAVVAADLSTLITFARPTTSGTTNLSCTYTLTLFNAATTPATTTATGTLTLKPQPTLSSGTLTVAPLSLAGGDTSLVSITLPSRTSVSNSVTSVNLAISGAAACGTGPVAKSNGNAVASGDLGNTITVSSPTAALSDSGICTYTLTVSNGTTGPNNQATATGTLTIIPSPTLSGAALTVAPAAITGGASAPATISVTLPQLTSAAASMTSATLTISGGGHCGTTVTKSGGGAVGTGDVLTSGPNAVTVNTPAGTTATDNLVCSYLLTVSNNATTPGTATATGTLTVKPLPTLGSASLTINPATITGGSTAPISITLPRLTSAAASMSAATLVISGGGNCTGPVTKNPSGLPVGTGDVLTSGTNVVAVNPPPAVATDNLSCIYTLTVSNGATTPATATATGTLTVVPAPVLSSSTFTLSPATIVSTTTPTITTTLPSQTAGSFGGVTFQISGAGCGTGDVPKVDTTLVNQGDLGHSITFNAPSSNPGDNLVCTYTLTVSNTASTAATVTATGTLNVVSTPIFNAGFTVTPDVIPGGTTTPLGLLKFAMPSLSNSGTATSIAMTVTPAGGATTTVTKTGSVTLVPGDLGTTVSVDPPTSSTTVSKVYTYSLTATNLAGTSAPVTTTVTTLPTGANLAGPRIGSTSTLLPNGTVLIVGGGDSISQGKCAFGTTSNTAEVYDPSAGTLTAVAGTMATNRCLHTAVLVPASGTTGKVFIMGGANDATVANNVKVDVFQYDTGTASPFGTWQTTAMLATARIGPSATLIGGSTSNTCQGKIVVAGGYTTSGAGINTLECFDPGAGTSSIYSFKPTSVMTTTLSTGRGEHAAVVMGQWLFLIGGYDGTTYASSIDALDLTRFVNSTLSNSQIVTSSSVTNAVSRAGHAAIALDATTMLVAGGYDGSSALTSMQKYTVDTNAVGAAHPNAGKVTAISTAQNLATGRARFPLLAAGPLNKYIVFGGSSTISTNASPDTATSSIEVIDNSGVTLSASGFGNLKQARQAPSAVNLNLSATSNFAFLIAGGGTASGGTEIVAGP
jgi:surface adhesion protein